MTLRVILPSSLLGAIPRKREPRGMDGLDPEDRGALQPPPPRLMRPKSLTTCVYVISCCLPMLFAPILPVGLCTSSDPHMCYIRWPPPPPPPPPLALREEELLFLLRVYI